MKDEIILFQPEEPQKHPVFLPYSLLPIAGTLDNAGYRVRIVDARFEDYTKVDLNNVIFCGITSFTGHQLKYALEVAKWIRSASPDTPIVWGGIHASLLPEQTCKHPLVDIVVVGEGEETVVELAEAIANDKPLDSIRGIVYKVNGMIKENEARPWTDMDNAPLPPYHLLKKEHYRLEAIALNTSRGCPFQCTFCFNRNWNKLSYRYQSPEKAVEQIEWAKKHFPDVNHFKFSDDNFFVKFDRVKDVCRGVIEKDLNITWAAMCRADYVAKFDDEMFQLLKASGCNGFGIGGESGSIRILRKIKKGITPEILLKAVKRAGEYDIPPEVSFMMGFPGETLEEVYQTLDFVDKMREVNPAARTNAIMIFTPYPGTEAFDEAVEHGLEVPDSIEGWASRCFGEPEYHPWLTDELRERLNIIQGIGYYLFSAYAPFTLSLRPLIRRVMKAIMKTSAKIRWRYRLFDHALEWKLYARFMVGKR